MKNGNVMGFRGYRFFSPKSSNAKYSMLGTSEANFGGKKGVQYSGKYGNSYTMVYPPVRGDNPRA